MGLEMQEGDIVPYICTVKRQDVTAGDCDVRVQLEPDEFGDIFMVYVNGRPVAFAESSEEINSWFGVD